MKKFLTMLLALVMVLSLAACSSQKGGDVNGGFPASALDLLTAVWNAYPESEKFSVVGGSLDNPVDNAPGAFPVDDADNLDYMLHFPADKSDLIDDAASLTHMMNANSFTCGAFHVKTAATSPLWPTLCARMSRTPSGCAASLTSWWSSPMASMWWPCSAPTTWWTTLSTP